MISSRRYGCFSLMPVVSLLARSDVSLRLQQVVTPIANWPHALFSGCRSPDGRFHAQRPLWFHVIRESTTTTRYFGLLSLHQPSFCVELVHCNEIVEPLVQCEKPTPETMCTRGKLGEKTASESSFPKSTQFAQTILETFTLRTFHSIGENCC